MKELIREMLVNRLAESDLQENKSITISKKIANEFEYLEVDTLSDDSPAEKVSFVKALQSGKRSPNGSLKLTLGDKEINYMKRSLKNMEDIARDNMDGRLANSVRTLMKKL
jgi:hypothetical protein